MPSKVPISCFRKKFDPIIGTKIYQIDRSQEANISPFTEVVLLSLELTAHDISVHLLALSIEFLFASIRVLVVFQHNVQIS